ncbi:MAG TPA: T9SS type A sorting domain-containing protein, partial [Chitinophagaceae bacterium]|nr:T9SS type A sorting domain-containing protein [Chitinophagaceae bacterium]
GGCGAVTITPGSGSINLGGLTSPVVTVQVFNSSWASVYNQTLTNSPGTHTVPSLTAGTYHVKVSFYSATWSPVCDKSQDAVVQSGTPPPPPPGGCDAVTISPANGSINLGGLTAAVITVQAFNNSWATVYNQTFTNSPGTQTIPSLAIGTYHVKVRFSTASWTFICEKMVDAVVSSASSANTFATTATENVMATRQSKVALLSSNPIKETIKLRFELERKQKIAVSILDVQGRIVYANSTSYGQGIHEWMFTPGSLPAGSYFLKVVGDTFTETKKIIRQ